MRRVSLCVIAAAACMAATAPASARHHVHHRYHRHLTSLHARPGVIPDVLVANPYGDVIIDGKTGFHRSDLGVMVPDSEPQSFVATGRASRTFIGGANGLPGRNYQ